MATELTALTFAVPREVMYLRRALCRQRIPEAPCLAWRSADTVLLVTGMGPAACERAYAWLLAGRAGGPIRRALCGGFCGALDDRWRVGALVQPDAVCDEAGAEWPLEVRAPVAPRACLVSASEVVSDAAARAACAARARAAVVDMETATAARLCRDAGVPLSGLRAVSDDVRRPVSPALARALAGEVVRPTAILGAVLRRPWLVAELFRLAQDSRHAAQALAGGVIAWLDLA